MKRIAALMLLAICPVLLGCGEEGSQDLKDADPAAMAEYEKMAEDQEAAYEKAYQNAEK